MFVRTADGVDLSVMVHGRPHGAVGLVLAHGFTMTSADRRLARLADTLARSGRTVYTFDFRGHGRSDGQSTLGDLEVLDVDAVLRFAAGGGHRALVLVGASMGGFVSIRHAALLGGEDAVVAISTPATWGVSPRPRARALMAAVNSPMGRRLLLVRGTRVAGGMDTAVPGSPSDLAGRITIPVGVIHGERDRYVPVDDAVLIHSRLAGPRRLVVLPDFGHAEAAYSPAFADVVEDVIDGLLDRAATADSGVGA